MIIVHSRNVNEAFWQGMNLINNEGKEEETRIGKALVVGQPVTTIYSNPMERVLFNPVRNCNPYFHFMEGIWMLAGRHDVEFLARYNKRMKEFSDNGVTFHGAYGARWRCNGQDQLDTLIKMLKHNPGDRRAVLQMWDQSMDLGFEGKDFPCNLIITFRINKHRTENYDVLDMHVFNRSNDMIWGAYGANAVHMSMLQEVMATCIGVRVGKYYQISTNFHVYRDVFDPLWEKKAQAPSNDCDYYKTGEYAHYPLVNDPELFFQELDLYFEDEGVMGFKNKLFADVIIPMEKSWEAHKVRDRDAAMAYATGIGSADWRVACLQWLERIYK